MAGTSPAKSPMIAAAAAPRLRPLDAGGHEAIPSRPRFDPHVAHPARVYNLWLGGKDGYAADREAAEQVARCRPQTVIGARANRAFLTRVVRHLAGNRGVGQFVDIGCGLPAPDSTHEVAQAVVPQARVVYVDNDPLVGSHARALLASGPAAHAITSRLTCAILMRSCVGPPARWILAARSRCCCWRFCISFPVTGRGGDRGQTGGRVGAGQLHRDLASDRRFRP
jgi:hypothetical protein